MGVNPKEVCVAIFHLHSEQEELAPNVVGLNCSLEAPELGVW